LREQLLAANNLLIGTTNLLLIGVPDTWCVAQGHAGPEVERWTQYRDRRWMTLGQAPYRLVDPHPQTPSLVRAEVELLVVARPAEAAPSDGRLLHPGEAGEVELAGHQAHFTYGSVMRGFLRGREVPALQVAWTCPRTCRHILLEYSASFVDGGPTATLADLAVLLQAQVAGVRCH